MQGPLLRDRHRRHSDEAGYRSIHPCHRIEIHQELRSGKWYLPIFLLATLILRPGSHSVNFPEFIRENPPGG